jgi:cyanophycinase-like exopeptidase
MLGIGIDETTAIWVEGTTAEVLGPHSVTFYDQNPDVSSKKIGSPVILMKGEKYDLKLRKQIDL